MSIPEYKSHIKDISAGLATMRADQPDLMKAFNEMAAAATRDGALSEKQKELIALALGVASHCDACIGYHMKALVRLGATLPEIEETLGMCVYMGGGPSLMYASNALAAYKEFTAQA